MTESPPYPVGEVTTPTIRDLCAALAGDVDYLIACIRDGSSDSCALQECLDRANTARDLLAAEPVGEGPSKEELTQFLFDNFRGPIEFICNAEEEAHVMIQNHIKFALAAFARWGRPAAPPALEVGDVGVAVADLRCAAASYSNRGFSTDARRYRRAATLLEQQQHLLGLAGAELDRLMAQQLSAPAPAVVPVAVPVAVAERLPDLSPQGSDFNDAGLLWWFKPRLGWRIGSRDALDCIPYPTHWLPFHAIPLPQGGEGEV